MRRVVIAGCGSVSSNYFRAAAEFEDIDRVGIVDIDSTAIESKTGDFNLDRIESGTDLSSVIERTGCDLAWSLQSNALRWCARLLRVLRAAVVSWYPSSADSGM